MPNSTEPLPSSNSSHRPEPVTMSFAIRTLITIAERRKGADALRCRLALLHCEAATLIHRSLRRALARHGLNDLQFTVLVILFLTEPDPLSASVMAEHAGVSRPAMTDALDKLEAGRFVTRTRDKADRRVTYVRITPKGQDTVDRAINEYLHTAAETVHELRPDAQRVLLTANLDLLRTLARGDRGQPQAPAI